MNLRHHHVGRNRVALLKQTFLAARLCGDDDELNTDVMDEVRHELIAAREASAKANVVAGGWAKRLDIRRVVGPPDLPTLVSAVVPDADDPWCGVIFSGAVGVKWPVEWFKRIPNPDG